MSASEAPVLLGRICSSWRAISLSTPRLWASLHVVEPLPPGPSGPAAAAAFDQKVAQRLEITKTWLGRSGHCLLSISLQSAPEDAPHGVRTTASATSIQFIQTLVPFAPRWYHVHFTTPPSILFEVMSYIDAEMPELETVAFHHQVHRPLHACGPFNMLRGARISSFSIPGSISMLGDLPLRWNQLTTLTVGGPPWTVPPSMTSDVLLRVISGCPELRCCKLMVHDPTSDILIWPHPIVELPFLHTLAIHCIASVATAALVLLMHLSLPELRNLTILGSAQEDSPSQTLGNFFASLVRLESLRIDASIFSTTSFLEILHTLPPSILRLAISDVENPWGPRPGLDDMLAVLTTSPDLCPALQHLSVDHGYGLSDQAVLLFITARMQEPCPTLHRVNIDFGRHILVDIMPDLQAFIEMGLAVSLVYLPPRPPHSPWQGLPDAPTVNPPAWTPPPSISYW
ncbi:hypothetical protein B0H12DRAFT_1118704 [Mycena haematopus]|nr:hypothetical protein B0H12DRAFT_1118704 [Mycena haematopus]